MSNEGALESTRLPIQVRHDHLEKLARRGDPIGAIEELIWNALDADADWVHASYTLSGLAGVDEVTVSDRGTGITPERIRTAFTGLGGSWKRDALASTKGRSFHGRNGYGRFRVLALGRFAHWSTVADSLDGRVRSDIRYTDGDGDFDLRRPVPTQDKPGTVVKVVGDARNKHRLTSNNTLFDLTCRFAVYLGKYPNVEIYWGEDRLDPQDAVAHDDEYPLEVIESETSSGAGASVAPILRVVEWNVQPARKELLLCDANGVNHMSLSTQVQAPEFRYTAYILWDGFKDVSNLEAMEAEFEHGSALGSVVTAARNKLREHFKIRRANRTKEIIEDWTKDGIYPYMGLTLSGADRLEQETFDEVAALVHRHIKGPLDAKKTQLYLLRESLRRQPVAMPDVLDQLFRLTIEQKKQLNSLVDRTTMSNLVAANSMVADRLDFLRLLNTMLFEAKGRKATRERDQLQPMLEKEFWIFGDEYTSISSEIGLTEALARHLPTLRPTRSKKSEPVKRVDGRSGRIDLLLSGSLGNEMNGRKLVIELKRPNVTLGDKEVAQLRSYALAVIADDRYKEGKDLKWDFWLVGNSISKEVQWQLDSNELPAGCLQSGPVSLWVRTWGEIIRGCETRQRSQKELLDYESDQLHAAEYAARAHPELETTTLI